MGKKGNIYFVNIANIENTVHTVNTANNKNNILIYLTLRKDRLLPVESIQQIDFENTRDEDVDVTSRKGCVDYSLIYSIFLIATILMNINTVAAQTTKVTLELMKVRLTR